MILRLASLCIALLLVLACGTTASLRPQGAGLSERFLAALNTKDKAALKAFLESDFDRAMPSDQRVERLWPLVEQGAPFKIVKVVDDTPQMHRAIIEDKSGERLGLTLMLNGNPPKISRLMLGGPEALNAPPPKDYTGWKSVGTLAADLRRDTTVPALGIAVWREGAALEVAVDGVRRVGETAPVTANDVWHVGSIGKSITSTLIGRLTEMGKLRWDMTLKEALPGVPMKPGYEKVTLEQIMHHRGGIPRDMNFTGVQVMTICGNEKDPTKVRGRYIRDILGRDPIAAPGERFAYSNAGYALLGHIAETKMGKPYEQLVRELVFAPLGMKASQVGEVNLPAGRPSGHVPDGKGWKPHKLGGQLGMMIAPAGDIWCSLGDLARFCRAHLDGLRGRNGLLKSATVKRLHEGTPEDPGGPIYACGWSVGPLPETSVRHGHNGSNGTFRAEMALFVEQGLVAVSIVNSGGEAEPSPSLQAVMAVAKRYAPAKR